MVGAEAGGCSGLTPGAKPENSRSSDFRAVRAGYIGDRHPVLDRRSWGRAVISSPVALHDVVRAAARIAPFVRRTPLERSVPLSAELGIDVWLKLECWQRTGSFKLRGALNRLLTLSEEARARGVATCSAGNHGLGVAEASWLTGVPATVVVPGNVSSAKLAGLRLSGAEVLIVGADYDEAEARAPEIAASLGLTFVSPYDDPAVVAGAGTVTLEILEELPEAGTLVVPIGGGGLAAGAAVVAGTVAPGLRLVGAQAAASPAMHAALAAGRLVPVADRPTLADGLAGNVAAGSMTFPLVRDAFAGIALVDEAAIGGAMLTLLDRHRVVVEGSGAVGLAALRSGALSAPPEPVVLLVSGGNVATDVLSGLLCAGS